MFNGKYTSLERVVEKAYRDAGLESVDWENAIEWAGELIGLLGSPAQYVDKTTNGTEGNFPPILIKDNRGELPDDFILKTDIRRIKVNDDGSIIGMSQMVESSDDFYLTPTNNNIYSSSISDPIFKTYELIEDEEGENTEVTPVTYTADKQYISDNQIYTYKINGGFIFTDFSDGYIELSYKGYPSDERGLPLIPDDDSYIKALEWYIIAMLDLRKWRQNPSPQNKSILNHSETQRDWYVGQSRNKFLIPDIDEMEALKNQWVRSIEKTNAHSNGFKTLGMPEIRYNHNRNIRLGRSRR